MPVNAYTAGGLVVGLVVGIYIGRRWAEYFRALDDGRRVMAARQNYHGRSTLAVVIAVVAVVGVAIAFSQIAGG